MERRLINAILTAYHKAKPHLMDEVPDRFNVLLLVGLSLGDLRELDRQHEGEQVTLSGGTMPRQGEGSPHDA